MNSTSSTTTSLKSKKVIPSENYPSRQNCRKSSAEECIFDYMELHIECRSKTHFSSVLFYRFYPMSFHLVGVVSVEHPSFFICFFFHYITQIKQSQNLHLSVLTLGLFQAALRAFSSEIDKIYITSLDHVSFKKIEKELRSN